MTGTLKEARKCCDAIGQLASRQDADESKAQKLGRLLDQLTKTIADMATEIEKVVAKWQHTKTKTDAVIKVFQSVILSLKSFVSGVKGHELHKSCQNGTYRQDVARALYHSVKGFLDEITPLLKMTL